MLTFVFWNMGGELPKSAAPGLAHQRRSRLLAILENLAKLHDVDLMMLAECPVDPSEALHRMNLNVSAQYHNASADSHCERITILSRLPKQSVGIMGASESPSYTCRRVRPPGREEFLLFAAHLGSKLYKGDASQALAAPGFSSEIRTAEKLAKHQRTILVGDFNLNPFDDAMVGAEGINAVMTRDVAALGGRTVDGKEYPFFYNPMWGLFGDSSHELYPPGHDDHEPAGTCFFRAGESRWYYWYMLDQVLIRPALLPSFRNRDLRILTTDRATSFLDKNGRPARAIASDHLPLLFRLEL